MPADIRKKLFVDRHVQGAIITRAIAYCLLSTGMAVACFALWQQLFAAANANDAGWHTTWTVLASSMIALLVLTPVFIFDSLRVTNRFVGPLVRMRRSLRKIAQGDSAEPILFRNDDYWHEFAEEFNAAIARIERDKILASRGESAIVQSLYPIEVD